MHRVFRVLRDSLARRERSSERYRFALVGSWLEYGLWYAELAELS